MKELLSNIAISWASLEAGRPHASCHTKKKEQLVLDEMEKDTAGNHGLKMMQHRIAHHTGHHLTRDFVSEVMHKHDSEGFKRRDPTAKKIHRLPKVPIGIHERWAGDGHDKLYGIGFPIWAVVDDATGRWLDGWVVPSNRMGAIIGYLFLCLVEKYGGKPAFVQACIESF